MAALDAIHEPVKQALIKEGWTITDDPFTIEFLEIMLFADLGAERTLGAQRGNERILVEVKTFASQSPMTEFERALGQYLIYAALLELRDPKRRVFLAISTKIYEDFFQQSALQYLVKRFAVGLIVVNVAKEEVVLWTS